MMVGGHSPLKLNPNQNTTSFMKNTANSLLPNKNESNNELPPSLVERIAFTNANNSSGEEDSDDSDGKYWEEKKKGERKLC